MYLNPDDTKRSGIGLSFKGFILFFGLQLLFLEAKIDGRIDWNWFSVLIPTIFYLGCLVFVSVTTASNKGWRSLKFYMTWN
jgi:hypothetical protein